MVSKLPEMFQKIDDHLGAEWPYTGSEEGSIYDLGCFGCVQVLWSVHRETVRGKAAGITPAAF
ncbi:MAG: hypothetical protein HFH72_15420 [Lachnospiraceae bacterium]|nr:hypothetical protein [Lachnospiraceae bacterium]RKI29173.1 hypothetical protein D7V72_08405 [bacterium D16-36]RKI70455.1 hypothetical protein D7V82_07570 [bacterium 1xD8-6]